jgi:hypothetical protein
MFFINVFEEFLWGIFSNSSTSIEINHSSHANKMSFSITIQALGDPSSFVLSKFIFSEY